MKVTMLVLSFLLASSAFSVELKNGVVISNLPTASKSYNVVVDLGSDVYTAKSQVANECAKDKASAEAFVVKSGSKIVVSQGCELNVVESRGCDQGGCRMGTTIKTSFEVLFK